MCLAFAQPPGAFAVSAEEQQLSAVEQQLFFKSFTGDDTTARLGRIERQIFGEELSGSTADRLSKIDEAMKARGSQTMPKPESAPPQPAQPAVNPEQEAKEREIERAQYAAMAARDQQIDRLLAEGVELWRGRKAHEAVDRFEQVLRLDNHNAQAYYSMGIIYESTGNLVEASAMYRKALSEHPNQSDYQQAVKDIEKKVAAKSKTAQANSDVQRLAEEASAAFKRGEFFSAMDLYKQLDLKSPNQASVKYNIGTLYLMLKDPHSALNYYKMAHRLSPNESKYLKAYKQLEGNIANDQANRQQAEAAWQGESSAPAQPGTMSQEEADSLAQMKQLMTQQGWKGSEAIDQMGLPSAPGQQPARSQPAAAPQQYSAPTQPGQYSQQQPMRYQQQPTQYAQQQPTQYAQQQPTQYAQQQPTQYPQQQPAQYTQQSTQYAPPTQTACVPQQPSQIAPPPQPAPKKQRPPSNQDVLATFGLIGRATHDGFLVTTVGLASRAHRAGLQPNDVIKAVDGTIITSSQQLVNILLPKQSGSQAALTVQRGQRLGQMSL